MLALGIETAGDMAGVALVDETGVVAEYNFRHRQDLTRRLMPNVAHLMDDAGKPRDALDLIAVSIGPGSFTGLRIGVACAKTIAQALGCGIEAIPTLEAFARGALGRADGMVCTTLRARSNEFYVGLYRQLAGRWETILEDGALAVPDLVKLLAAQGEPVLVCGEIWNRNADAILALGDEIRRAEPWQNIPRAASVAAMGIERAQAGQWDDLMALAPRYTRPSQAEIRLEEGRLVWDKK